MFCGSCLRDNALAAELMRRGHDVVLSPVYTPTKTDEANVSDAQVFFGGISVFLEQHSAIFRHTPRFVDKLWDSSWALRLATRRQIKVDAKSLGEMTVSMLRGERGFQAKEIEKLLEWLRAEPRFDVINLPYSLLTGLAEPLKRELKVPICVTLQGDDLFLDQLGEPHRSEAMRLIHEWSAYVDAYIAVSQYYVDYMPEYLGIPRDEDAAGTAGHHAGRLRPRAARPAVRSRSATWRALPLRKDSTFSSTPTRVCASGRGPRGRVCSRPATCPPSTSRTSTPLARMLENAGLEAEFEYRGEIDRDAKVSFLQELDVLSVPTTYREPKGLFVFEAMASGVPVVQPRHGAFPEIVERTGGGMLVEPDDPQALSGALAACAPIRRSPRRSARQGRPPFARTTACRTWPSRSKRSTAKSPAGSWKLAPDSVMLTVTSLKC